MPSTKLVLIVLLSMMIGCFQGINTTARNLSPAEKQMRSDIIWANNVFALNLFKAVATHLKNESGQASLGSQNMLISPFSVSVILHMIMAGAGGNSYQEVGKVLNYIADFAVTSDERVQWDWQSIFATLASDLNTSSGTTILKRGNGLYIAKGFSINPLFESKITELFQPTVRSLDFGGKPNEAQAVINKDVAIATQDYIKELIPKGVLNEAVRLVLTSAIFFQGNWKNKFDPSNTHLSNFTADDGTVSLVEMMHDLRKVPMSRYEYNGKITKVLKLDYSDARYALYIILPQLGDLANVLNQLDSQDKSWFQLQSEMKVNIAIPKFEMKFDVNLPPVLRAMKVQDIFSPSANLSAMTSASHHGNTSKNGRDGPLIPTEDLYVSQIFHKALIRVDESGSVAAGVSGSVISAKSIPIIRDFHANRPFIYLIRDSKTELILFMGIYAKPPNAQP